jgi:hypothetical protein
MLQYLGNEPEGIGVFDFARQQSQQFFVRYALEIFADVALEKIGNYSAHSIDQKTVSNKILHAANAAK